jgi:hypothetical protein
MPEPANLNRVPAHAKRNWIAQTLLLAPIGAFFILLPFLIMRDEDNLVGKLVVGSLGAMILYVDWRLWQIRLFRKSDQLHSHSDQSDHRQH